MSDASGKIQEQLDKLREKFPEIDKHLETLRVESGEVWAMPFGETQVVYKCPSQQQLKAFSATSYRDRADVPVAQERLARGVIVFPKAEALTSLAAKRPGLYAKVANDAAEVASEELPDFSKKVEPTSPVA